MQRLFWWSVAGIAAALIALNYHFIGDGPAGAFIGGRPSEGRRVAFGASNLVSHWSGQLPFGPCLGQEMGKAEV